MSPYPQLNPTFRGDGEKEQGRIDRGNAPRIFRSRFVNFHIFFRTVDIKKPGQMVAALFIICFFSLLSTVLFFMMQRYEKRALMSRKRRWTAAPMFALRLLFVYCLVLLVEIMNIWIIFAVVVGHMIGWLLYFMYIKECLGSDTGDAGDRDEDGDDGDGKGRQFNDSSVSSESSDGQGHGQRQFWDLT